jgi:hypothetical protein
MRDERREMRDDRMIDEGLKTKRIGSVRELDVYRIKILLKTILAYCNAGPI